MRNGDPERKDAFPILRVARPSDDLEALRSFYVDGLGLPLAYAFQNHDGFDGMIVGGVGSPYHLEFTRADGHKAGRAPSPDHLLVFYHPDPQAWRSAAERMQAAGFAPVTSFNPYWDRRGLTFEDPDGYRVVLHDGAWRQSVQSGEMGDAPRTNRELTRFSSAGP